MTARDKPDWYMDTRLVETTEQLSLDLTRHLPQRLAVGAAVIVAEKPTILLPVIRKRWMRIIREVERQRASTLDRTKRQSLERELYRLRSLRFTTKITQVHADVLVITPDQAVCELPPHHTLYVVAPITIGQFTAIVEGSDRGGVVVIYGEWAEYERVLREYCAKPGDDKGQDTANSLED